MNAEWDQLTEIIHLVSITLLNFNSILLWQFRFLWRVDWNWLNPKSKYKYDNEDLVENHSCIRREWETKRALKTCLSLIVKI